MIFVNIYILNMGDNCKRYIDLTDYSQPILSRTLPFIGQHDNCELFRRQITPKDLAEFLARSPFTLAYGAVPQAGPQKFGFCWKKGFIRGIWGHS